MNIESTLVEEAKIMRAETKVSHKHFPKPIHFTHVLRKTPFYFAILIFITSLHPLSEHWKVLRPKKAQKK